MQSDSDAYLVKDADYFQICLDVHQLICCFHSNQVSIYFFIRLVTIVSFLYVVCIEII